MDVLKQTKYLVFCDVATPKKRITQIVNIYTTGGILLGTIKYYPAWRQYTVYPEPDTVFNSECLKDIKDMLDQLNNGRRKKNRKIK